MFQRIVGLALGAVILLAMAQSAIATGQDGRFSVQSGWGSSGTAADLVALGQDFIYNGQHVGGNIHRQVDDDLLYGFITANWYWSCSHGAVNSCGNGIPTMPGAVDNLGNVIVPYNPCSLLVVDKNWMFFIGPDPLGAFSSSLPFSYQWVDGNFNLDGGARCQAWIAAGHTGKRWYIGNEMNSSWGNGGETWIASEYAKYFHFVYTAIHGWDPTATIVMGALISNGTKDAVNDCSNRIAAFNDIANYYIATYGSIPGGGFSVHEYTFQGLDQSTIGWNPNPPPGHNDANFSMYADLKCMVDRATALKVAGLADSGKVFVTEMGVSPTDANGKNCWEAGAVVPCTMQTTRTFMANWISVLRNNFVWQPGLGLDSWYWWSWDYRANDPTSLTYGIDPPTPTLAGQCYHDLMYGATTCP